MQLNSKYTVTNVWQKPIKFCKAIILHLKNKAKWVQSSESATHSAFVFINKSLILY